MDRDALLSDSRISSDDPRNGPSRIETALAAIPRAPATTGTDAERTGVFTSLVKEDGDIAGLVAYSIYKQNKLDWLQAFEAAKTRVPNESELSAYIIGESTPRRLATYRHLAEATLAGNGPDIDGTVPSRATYMPGKSYVPGKSAHAAQGPLRPALLAIGALVAIIVVGSIWIAVHYTVAAR